MSKPSTPAHFFILIGPSGAGKTTVLERLLSEASLHLTRALTTTSRAPREGEIDGVDYHFISVEHFKSLIAQNAFFEWVDIYGAFYGTERARLTQLRETAQRIISTLEPIGAQKIKQTDPAHTTIILLETPKASLIERLHARHFSPEALAKRLERIDHEHEQYPKLADVRVDNIDGKLEETVTAVKTIIEKTRF